MRTYASGEQAARRRQPGASSSTRSVEAEDGFGSRRAPRSESPTHARARLSRAPHSFREGSLEAVLAQVSVQVVTESWKG